MEEIEEQSEGDYADRKLSQHSGSIDTKRASMSRTENLDKLNMLEKFFDGPWNDWVKKHKWAIVLSGILLSVYAAARSREIKGLSQMERYFP